MTVDKKGANNLTVKCVNKRSIRNLLYARGSLTKQEIASLLKLSLPTVSNNILQLKEEGLVAERGTQESTGGRKPQLLHFEYNARISIGIDISKSRIRVVILNMAGDMLSEKRVKIPFEQTQSYWINVRQVMMETLQEGSIDEKKILGIGIAVPGTVNQRSGILELAPTLGLKNFPVKTIQSYFTIPVHVENEANSAGFAEVSKSTILKNVVYLSITKGVGGALIVNDSIFYGDNNRSGEFGHMTIIPGGELCTCGRKGCLEAYCSVSVLAEHTDGDLELFFVKLENGDENLRQVWDSYLEHLALGIVNLRMAFDTDIIIGGDLDEYLLGSFEQLYRKVKSLNPYEDTGSYIRLGQLGRNSSAIGAALKVTMEFLELI